MAGIKISDLPPVVVPALTDIFPVDQGLVTYKESLQQVFTLFQANGSALTKTDDTNVTLTLGGSPATALLNAASLTLGWTGQLSVPRGGTGSASFTAYAVICGGTTSTGALQSVSGVGTSGQVLVSNGPAALPTWQAVPAPTGAALTEVNDTNVTMVLGGTPTTALLQAVSMTLGWTGQLSPTRGGTGIGTYTLGDTLYASAANTLAKLAGNTTTAKQYLSQTGDGVNSAAPAWATISGADITGAALTKTDDTNVTLTLGGTPSTALLRAASLTLGWSGQLSLTRGGTNASLTASNGGIVYSTASAMAILSGTATANQLLLSGASGAPSWSTLTHPSTCALGDILYGSSTNVLSTLTGNITTAKQYLSQTGNGAATAAPAWATISGSDITGAALTKTDDTNVTLTLGGTPTTALLRATSLTLGWTGQLGLTRGGTAASLTASNGGIVYSTASALAILAGTATAGQMLQSGASTTPAWSTSTYPATNAINTLLYASSANVMAALPTANNGILVTSSGGVPSISSTLPQAVINNFTTPTLQVFTSSSGTYTTPANCRWIRIRLTGAGGGSEGSGTSLTGTAAGNGGDTTFSTLTGSGGKGGGGVSLGVGGLGGAATGGNVADIAGGAGEGGLSGVNGNGGAGGGTPLGPASFNPNGANGAAIVGNPFGAGAAGPGSTATVVSGAGGGGGGYVEHIIGSPAATYSYAVGGAGSAGAAGTGGKVGTTGGAGLIIVEEYYT